MSERERASEIVRINPQLKRDLMEAGKERVRKGLMNVREVTLPKMTELSTRTYSYKQMLNELKMKPEKKKLI